MRTREFALVVDRLGRRSRERDRDRQTDRQTDRELCYVIGLCIFVTFTHIIPHPPPTQPACLFIIIVAVCILTSSGLQFNKCRS